MRPITWMGKERPNEFTKKTKRLVKEAQGNRCDYCGNKDCLEVHHKKPIVHGGGREPENAVGLCPCCHREFDKLALHEHRYYDEIVMEESQWYVIPQIVAYMAAVEQSKTRPFSVVAVSASYSK